jgi:RNA polymerase sigma factor (sigma-70 family)
MDAAEFKEKVIPLSGKLFHFARLLLKDHAEAEDSVQEIFLKLWKMRFELAEYNNLEAFAMRITRNWCLDRLKAKKPVYIESYSPGLELHSEKDNPLRMLENTDQMATIRKHMQNLPEQQQAVIQLRDMDGFEYEEIAAIMGMNVNAVRVTLSRARNSIREHLIKIGNYGHPANQNPARQI